MKLAKKITIAAAMALWAGLFLAAQKPADLVGTWSGEATLEGQDGPNTLTLVLELKEGKLTGHMTDQYGGVNGEIKDIVLEKSAFNFTAPAIFKQSMYGQSRQGSILFKMELSGDSMKGEIEIPEMSAKGTWQAAKNK